MSEYSPLITNCKRSRLSGNIRIAQKLALLINQSCESSMSRNKLFDIALFEYFKKREMIVNDAKSKKYFS